MKNQKELEKKMKVKVRTVLDSCKDTEIRISTQEERNNTMWLFVDDVLVGSITTKLFDMKKPNIDIYIDDVNSLDILGGNNETVSKRIVKSSGSHWLRVKQEKIDLNSLRGKME